MAKAATPPGTAPGAALLICDPLAGLSHAKDTSVALMHSLQTKGWSVHCLEPDKIWLDGDRLCGRVFEVRGAHPAGTAATLPEHLERAPEEARELDSFSLALMRLDPPVDERYLKITWLLDFLDSRIPVLNPPSELRNMSEKLSTLRFGAAPATLVSSDGAQIESFARRHGKIVIKPINALGGRSVYVLSPGDSNLRVLLDDLLGRQTALIAQEYLEDIESAGDLRAMVIGGEPQATGLARLPAAGDHRGNILAAAKPELRELNQAQRRIARAVGDHCRQRRIAFAGLDFIGDRLTEINITSPTCVREMETLGVAGLSDRIVDAIIDFSRLGGERHPSPRIAV